LLTRVLTVIAGATVLAAALGAGSSPASTRSASAFHSVVVATLTPKNEVRKGPAAASGTARVTLNLKARKACWKVTVRGLSSKDKFLSANIHKAPAKKTGPVIIPLGYTKKGCVIVPKVANLKAVGTSPGKYYVNVYTKKFLQGAVRGQLRAG
jgi:CHRD domain-containing protein